MQKPEKYSAGDYEIEINSLSYVNVESWFDKLSGTTKKHLFKGKYWNWEKRLLKDKNDINFVVIEFLSMIGVKKLIEKDMLYKMLNVIISKEKRKQRKFPYNNHNHISPEYMFSYKNFAKNFSYLTESNNATTGIGSYNFSKYIRSCNISAGSRSENYSYDSSSNNASAGKGSKNISLGVYSCNASAGNNSNNYSTGKIAKNASADYESVNYHSGYMSNNASAGCNSENITNGDNSCNASAGNFSYNEMHGKNSVSVDAGNGGKAKGKIGCWFALTEWETDNYGNVKPLWIKATKIDGKKIKEDTWYTLKNGKFVIHNK